MSLSEHKTSYLVSMVDAGILLTRRENKRLSRLGVVAVLAGAVASVVVGSLAMRQSGPFAALEGALAALMGLWAVTFAAPRLMGFEIGGWRLLTPATADPALLAYIADAVDVEPLLEGKNAVLDGETAKGLGRMVEV